MNTKICTKCHQKKLLIEFGKRSISKDGLRFDCNGCRKKETKQYHLLHKEEHNLTSKLYRLKHKDDELTNTNSKLVNCKQCNKQFRKLNGKIKAYPNHFCCKVCSNTYNQTHKTKGYNVSKLELYLHKQLPIIYPSIEINFNRRDVIKKELDIYIPSLKLAIEINGLFHYKSIFGEEKLQQTQTNDNKKKILCKQHNIELHVIDVSTMNVFTEKEATPFLNTIQTIISNKNSF